MADSGPSVRRLVTEASVIVASILLAFAIDATWAAIREASEVKAALRSVEAELIANRSYFAEIEATHEAVVEAGFEMLTLTGPDPDLDSIERVQYLVGELWKRAGMFPPSSGAVSSLVASGRIGEIGSQELREAIAAWPDYLGRQRELLDVIYADNLFHERLVTLVAQLDIDRLNGMGGIPDLGEAFRAETPEASRLPSDYAALLSDLEFENGVTSRITASLVGGAIVRDAHERIDLMLRLLDEELR
ncbi:MAG TPA: hypothetical protein VJ884_03680 [Salinibacter sp.]|nr:hypothetical protein [Salinibacter sp.]